jgi:hypothetical protein
MGQSKTQSTEPLDDFVYKTLKTQKGEPGRFHNSRTITWQFDCELRSIQTRFYADKILNFLETRLEYPSGGRVDIFTNSGKRCSDLVVWFETPRWWCATIKDDSIYPFISLVANTTNQN